MNAEPNRLVADLVSELTDGTINNEGRKQLRQLLADDPDSLRWYSEWMQLHALLYLDLQHPSEAVITPNLAPALTIDRGASQAPVAGPRYFRGRQRRWALGLSAATLTALAASVMMLAYGPLFPTTTVRLTSSTSTYRSVPETIAAFNRTDGRAVAVLSRVADPDWDGAKPLDVGSPVLAGRFVLKSGIVQLEFLSGANLVVEGPAELDLASSMLVVCHRGKLRAYVPDPAKGFMVDTPHHRTVDLGTEFAINVGDDAWTEVHVLDGEVEVFDMKGETASGHPRSLTIGNALRALPNGDVLAIAANAGSFVGVEQLMSLSTIDSATRYTAWRQQSELFRGNPHVVSYFCFDDHRPWQRVLRQDGPQTETSLDGAIVGCRWAEGRWPGKGALEFKSTEDRVRLNIPGEFESISLACWVRVDGFDRWLSSLLLTDGHNLGEVHWQFTETGQLLLGVKAEREKSQEYLSETVLRPVDLGRWIHVACVYNKAQGEVVHYVDGRRVGAQPIVVHTPLRFGSSEIGNWVPEEMIDHRIRSLNGRIDEFVLLKESLTDEEIRTMYEAGRPHS